MEYIIKLIIHYESLTATVIGALLASFVGIIASVYLEWRRGKREQKKYMLVIKYELEHMLRQASLIKNRGHVIPGVDMLVASNTWGLARDILFNILTADDINCIDRFYNIAIEVDKLTASELEAKLFFISMGGGGGDMIDKSVAIGSLLSSNMDILTEHIEAVVTKLG